MYQKMMISSEELFAFRMISGMREEAQKDARRLLFATIKDRLGLPHDARLLISTEEDSPDFRVVRDKRTRQPYGTSSNEFMVVDLSTIKTLVGLEANGGSSFGMLPPQATLLNNGIYHHNGRMYFPLSQ